METQLARNGDARIGQGQQRPQVESVNDNTAVAPAGADVPGERMLKHIRRAACVLLLSGSAAASAQQAAQCPSLPPGSGLQWQEQAQNDFIVCKATTADGRTVLNVMLTARDPALTLTRALRAEKGRFAGEDLYWYRLDMGGRDLPGLEARRITTVKLAKNRFAQIWIDAGDVAELASLQQLTGSLDDATANFAGK